MPKIRPQRRIDQPYSSPSTSSVSISAADTTRFFMIDGSRTLGGPLNITGKVTWLTNNALSGTGVYAGQTAAHSVTVPTGQELSLINLEMTNLQATQAASQLYGIRLITTGEGIDTGAAINVGNFGRADGIYISAAGKSGVAANNAPTGLGIDVNRSGSGQQSSTHEGYGIQVFDWSSTNIGVDGPKFIKLEKINNVDSDHVGLEFVGNKRAIRIVEPIGGGFSSSGELIGVYNGTNGQQIWTQQASGNMFFHQADQGIFWDYDYPGSPGTALGGIRRNADYLDVRFGPDGFRLVNHTYTDDLIIYNNSGNEDFQLGNINFQRSDGGAQAVNFYYDALGSVLGSLRKDYANQYLEVKMPPGGFRWLDTAGTTELARIEDDGKMGIASAAPQVLLHVGAGTDASGIASTLIMANAAGSATISVRDSTNDIEAFMFAGPSIGIFGTYTNHDLALRTNNTTRLTIDNAGLVTVHSGNIDLITADSGIYWFTSPATVRAAVRENGNYLDVRGGSSGFRVVNNAYTTPRVEFTDAGNVDIKTGNINLQANASQEVWWDFGGGASAALRKNTTYLEFRIPAGGFRFLDTAGSAQLALLENDGDLLLKAGQRVDVSELRAADGNGLALRDDGANLALFVEDGGQVGIGTSTPPTRLSVETDGADNTILSASYGTGFVPVLALYSANGSQASPTATQASDIIGIINFQGFDTARSTGARIYGIAAAEWGTSSDDTDDPTDLRFATVPDGSATLADRLCVTSAGLVGIADMAPTAALLQVGAGSSTSLGGLLVNMPASTTGLAVTLQYNGTDYFRHNATSAVNFAALQAVNLGNDKAGGGLLLARNTNAGTEGPAAGYLRYQAASATNRFTWLDASNLVRIHSAAPTGSSGSPTTSDTAGSVLGDQTSWHEAKNVGERVTDAEAALRRILRLAVHEFTYKGQSYQAADGRPQTFTGLVGFDRTNWWLKNCGPQQIPALNEITVIGNLVLAIQALAQRMGATWDKSH